MYLLYTLQTLNSELMNTAKLKDEQECAWRLEKQVQAHEVQKQKKRLEQKLCGKVKFSRSSYCSIKQLREAVLHYTPSPRMGCQFIAWSAVSSSVGFPVYHSGDNRELQQ